MAASTCLACGAEVFVVIHNVLGGSTVADVDPHDKGRYDINFVKGTYVSIDDAKHRKSVDRPLYRYHDCRRPLVVAG